PGITLLENLLYALAETGFRGQFDIADLLTGAGGAIDHRQPFFTARNILTNAPVTNNDYRRLLIDSLGLSNAWAICKACACGPVPYAECKDGELSAAPRWRLALEDSHLVDDHEHPVRIKGFTDLLLQFAPHDELGNLNSHRLDGNLLYPLADGSNLTFEVELRFPEWRRLSETAFLAVVAANTAFTSVEITRLSRDRVLAEPVDNADFRQGIRNIFFLDLRLTFTTVGGQVFELNLTEVTLRLWPLGSTGMTEVDPTILQTILQDSDLAARYHRKLQARAAALATSGELLHDNRKVGEDFCRFERVRAEDVAVCADLHLAPEADVEGTLALFYRTLERLLNPSVPFRTLQEMEAANLSTEEIFSGPPLQHGFILQEDLDKSVLRTKVFVSDLVNELMDIEGVLAIEALRFTVYDDDGRPVAPAQEWCIPVREGHYPSLYIAASQIAVYKDGLPLLPRRAELRSILTLLRAEDRALALPVAELDYPIPTGTYRPVPDYVPVQRTLPATYGLSEEGLAESATAQRKAQARQLAGYLLPFEFITAQTAEQLNRFGDLFSTDESVSSTYPSVSLTGAGDPLEHLEDPLTLGALPQVLAELLEPGEVFADRRNRFLDHLLARFGESITNYTLLIHDQETRRAFGAEKLIKDKIRFLRFYPEISGRRGTGINYLRADGVCTYRNRSGLGERIRRLLGLEDVRSYFSLETEQTETAWRTTFRMTAEDGPLLTIAPALRRPTGQPGDPTGIFGDTAEAAENLAWATIREVIEQATDTANYVDNGGTLEIHDSKGEALAELTAGRTAAEVEAFIATALERERLYVVEHILLRPKFPGDALMSVCLSEDCEHRGMEDPYSFRLTYVLPANARPFSEDIDLRRYAERTIRRETPVHLLPKLCWISDEKARDEYTPEELEALDEACLCPPPDELARQLSRFEAVYCRYLELNKNFDWTPINDELEAAVLDLLPPAADLSTVRLLLGYFGENYRQYLADITENEEELPATTAADWADEVWPAFLANLNLIQQNDPVLFTAFGLPNPAFLAELRDLLTPFYTDWLEVSFRLHRLLLVFGQLRSAYPQATLHDCDDGDEDQPVRLDQTTLGTL
ncbi:MAG: hypothetical protein AAGA31_00450, partial [Bacteroidota bacterium]